ncbi:hypothetical protein K8R66_05225, partial [bacterium]|nr:hypothetical protein [bacterium]
EPIIWAKHVVHVSFPVLVGAGGVSLLEDKYYLNKWEDDYYYESLASQAYFVVEPGVEVEFNMVKFLRIGLGAYYRYTSDVALTYIKYDHQNGDTKITKKPELSGFSFGLSLKFGKF